MEEAPGHVDLCLGRNCLSIIRARNSFFSWSAFVFVFFLVWRAIGKIIAGFDRVICSLCRYFWDMLWSIIYDTIGVYIIKYFNVAENQ